MYPRRGLAPTGGGRAGRSAKQNRRHGLLRREVTSTKGGDTLTSRYQTNHKEEFAFAPDEEKNSELINTVLGKSLDQFLADTELRDFLSK